MGKINYHHLSRLCLSVSSLMTDEKDAVKEYNVNRSLNSIIVLVPFLTALSGCEQEQPPVEQIRAIKTITVSEQADTSTRKFSGVVMATDYSQLSFEVGGNVKSVSIDIGEKVREGQQYDN